MFSEKCSIHVCVPSQKLLMGSNTDTTQHPEMSLSPASPVCHGLQPFARIIFPPASATTSSPAAPAPLRFLPPVRALALGALCPGTGSGRGPPPRTRSGGGGGRAAGGAADPPGPSRPLTAPHGPARSRTAPHGSSRPHSPPRHRASRRSCGTAVRIQELQARRRPLTPPILPPA